MQDARAFALFEEVLDKTVSGRIKWEPTAEDDHFVASVGGKFTILARSYTWRDEVGGKGGGPSLVLKDAEGRELIRVTSSVEGLTVNQLSELYEMVRRQALRVDEKVDEVLAELGNLRREGLLAGNEGQPANLLHWPPRTPSRS